MCVKAVGGRNLQWGLQISGEVYGQGKLSFFEESNHIVHLGAFVLHNCSGTPVIDSNAVGCTHNIFLMFTVMVCVQCI